MNPIIVPVEDLILASGSESRKTMLNEAGLKFSVQPSSVDESIIKDSMVGKPFSDQVIALACAKAKDISKKFPNSVVIGGDQMCICNNTIFDKPGSVEKAINNLQVLSGTTHHQYSGVSIFKNGESLWEYYEIVEMNMHKLSDEEIINYVKIENPIHAAGAYKFESLGCNLFSSVNGSSYTIRGMPLLPLLSKLREMNVINLEQSTN